MNQTSNSLVHFACALLTDTHGFLGSYGPSGELNAHSKSDSALAESFRGYHGLTGPPNPSPAAPWSCFTDAPDRSMMRDLNPLFDALDEGVPDLFCSEDMPDLPLPPVLCKQNRTEVRQLPAGKTVIQYGRVLH